jgi:hypothetical protein
MRTFTSGLARGALLALGIGLLSTAGPAYADEEDDKLIQAAQKDVLDLAKAAENGKLNPAQVQAIRKKYEDLNHIMTGYKPRAKKGIGVGLPSPGDGIEFKLNNLGRRALSKMQLQKEKADLIKVGYINVAIAELIMQDKPKPKGGKGAKDWQQHSVELKKASLEFIDAVKKGNPAAVKAAANNINNSCTTCHSDFRDIVN